MKKSLVKTLKILCYVGLVCIVLWVVFYCVQSYFVLTQGHGEGVINWDSPRLGVKLSMFTVHRVALLTMAGLFAAFIVNILRSLRGGNIFSRANVSLLWVMAAVLPVYSFVSDNMSIAVSPEKHFDIVLTDNPFVYTFVALVVAILYKVAYETAEEQKLTI